MSRRSGIALFEVLAGSVLLGLMILPLLHLLTSVTRQTHRTRDRLAAECIARSVVERFRMEPLAALKVKLGDATSGAAVIASDPILSTAPRKKVDISCPCPCP